VDNMATNYLVDNTVNNYLVDNMVNNFSYPCSLDYFFYPFYILLTFGVVELRYVDRLIFWQ